MPYWRIEHNGIDPQKAVNEQPEREANSQMERDRRRVMKETERGRRLGAREMKVYRRKQKVPMLKSAKHSVPVFKNVFNSHD